MRADEIRQRSATESQDVLNRMEPVCRHSRPDERAMGLGMLEIASALHLWLGEIAAQLAEHSHAGRVAEDPSALTSERKDAA